MSEVHVYTCAAFNYIPKVRMLFKSVKEHHPDWKLHLALADQQRDYVDLSDEPFDSVTSVDELNIPSWMAWTFCHTIVELATAIKPFMLSKLLREDGCKKVIYLDPDVVVFSPLHDILDALDSSNIVLIPHQNKPETSLSAVIDNEICSLKHGIYNLGFIGVSATDEGAKFAEWWSKRVYHFCRDDIPNGLFTDQRWIDLVPAFFNGVAIMRSSRHDVATWNLTTRKLSISDKGRYLVDDEPLGFYHFTGFDSGAHRIMAAKNAGSNSAVQDIINWYDKETKGLSEDPLAKEPWAYKNFSDGTPISKDQRIVYRERLDLQASFKNPFDSETFLKWWNTQAAIEYPDLFNSSLREEERKKIFMSLTPGFQGGGEKFSWTKVFGVFKQSILHPKLGVDVSKRCWEVLKIEGVRGIKRRFFN